MKNRSQREREELESLMRNLNKKEEELASAMAIMNEDKKKVNQMKTDIDTDRELLLTEKTNLGEKRFELEMRENQLKDKIKLKEILKVKVDRLKEDLKHKMDRLLKDDNVLKLNDMYEEKRTTCDEHNKTIAGFTETLKREKETLGRILSDLVTNRHCMENEWKQQFEFKKRDLDKLKADLTRDREVLDRESETMNKEKMDLKMMRSEIRKQFDILEQKKEKIREERDSVQTRRNELVKNMEHISSVFNMINEEKSNFKSVILQVHTARQQLDDAMSNFNLKEKERQVKEDDLRRQRKELEIMKNRSQCERKELESLMRNLNNKEEQLANAMDIMNDEKEKVKQMKTDIDTDRELLLNEKRNLGEKRFELEMRENQLKDKMKLKEILKVKVDRMMEDLKHKMYRLLQNDKNVLKLNTVYEEKRTTCDEHNKTIARFTETLEREMEILGHILSDLVTNRHRMENEWKQQFEFEKQDLDKLKADLTCERELLDRETETMSKEKMDLKLIRSEILKQLDIIEQKKQNIKEQRDSVEIRRTELVKNIGHVNRLFNLRNEVKSNIKTLILQVQDDITILVECVRDTLTHICEKIRDDINLKMDRLQKQNDHALKLYTLLEYRLMSLDELKDNVECHTETLLREQDILRHTVSDVFNQRQGVEKECMQQFDLQKQTALVCYIPQILKQDRDFVDRVIESSTHNQFNLLEQKKGVIKQEKNKLEITRVFELQQSQNYHRVLDELNHQKQQLYQLRQQVKRDMEMFLNRKKTQKEDFYEVKVREDCLNNAINATRNLRDKLNKLIHEVLAYIDILEQKNGKILQLISILEQHCVRIHKQKTEITAYYELIQQPKKLLLTIVFDKGIQTENVVEEWLHDHHAKETDEHEYQQKTKDVTCDLKRRDRYLKPDETLLIVAEDEEFENVKKNKLAMLSKLSAEEDNFTKKGISRTDCLQKIWKDTRMERKEISQMKLKGQEMRNNVEKRLKVINQFVKRTVLQKEKTSMEKIKTILEQGQSKNIHPPIHPFSSESDWYGDHRSLDEKYTELQQLKVSMLSEIEKLHIPKKVSKTLETSNKANQTVQEDIMTEGATIQSAQPVSPNSHHKQMKVEEAEAMPERFPGLLSQLRLYCYRCCSPCCGCCKQMCPKKN